MRGISIHLTDRCNNSCEFCVVGSHQGKEEGVNRKLLAQFLQDNAGQGFQFVNIHGGEPTLLDNFVEILAEIQGYGYPDISLQTNGRRLGDVKFAQAVVQRGVSLCVVSLHEKWAEQHDNLTGVAGSFDETIKGILNVKTLGCQVRTNTVIYKRNYPFLPDIVDYAISLGADCINLSAMHPAGRAYQNFDRVTPRYRDITPYVFQAVERCVTRGIKVRLEGFQACSLVGYERFMLKQEDIDWKLLYRNFVISDYPAYMERGSRVRGEKCRACARTSECGGVYKEYVEFYGWDEFVPL